MKVVCHACSAEYSIAAQKISGHVVRTRCKQCGDEMVIRGDLGRVEGRGKYSAAPRLRNQRSETSVLFTLDVLNPDHARQTAPPVPEAISHEGSGLLDVRRLAQEYRDKADAEPDSMGGELGAAMPLSWAGTPQVLSPRYQRSDSRPLIALLGASSVIAITAMVLALVVAKGERSQAFADAGARKPAVIAVDGTGALLPGSVPAAPQEPVPVPGDTPTAAQEPVSEPAPEPEPAPAPSKPATPAQPKRPRPTPSGEAPAPAAESRSPAACMDEVACLLASDPPMCCSQYAHTSSAPAAEEPGSSSSSSGLPVRPNKAAITSGMGEVREEVAACGALHATAGIVSVLVKVTADGAVSSAKIKSSPSVELGQCVAKAVAGARFIKSQSGVSFTYPFRF